MKPRRRHAHSARDAPESYRSSFSFGAARRRASIAAARYHAAISFSRAIIAAADAMGRRFRLHAGRVSLPPTRPAQTRRALSTAPDATRRAITANISFRRFSFYRYSSRDFIALPIFPPSVDIQQGHIKPFRRALHRAPHMLVFGFFSPARFSAIASFSKREHDYTRDRDFAARRPSPTPESPSATHARRHVYPFFFTTRLREGRRVSHRSPYARRRFHDESRAESAPVGIRFDDAGPASRACCWAHGPAIFAGRHTACAGRDAETISAADGAAA